MALLATLGVFALVSSLTPGPNNLMLMASGANFGFRRTLPHMLGVSVGFTLMVFLVGIGVMKVFDIFPQSYDILKWVSVAYLLYLSLKIATASHTNKAGDVESKPFTFYQAVAFQWVNPKAWTMALSAISVYAPNKDITTVLTVAAIFGAINLPSITVWTTLGTRIRLLLTHPYRLKAFNYAMATLLVLSLYPVVFN